MMDVGVYKIGMAGPDDVSGLQKLVDEGTINASEIVAILGKTEGNGNVNDFTRGFSTMAFKKYLTEELNVSENELETKVAFVMSGGTEGVMSPHATIFTKREIKDQVDNKSKSLGIEVGFTRDFRPEEIGTMEMVKEVERVVKDLIEKAGIENNEDVHFVQIKCPLLTSDRVMEAKNRGEKVATEDTYKSMGYSRGASALGVALAVGEVDEAELSEEDILSNWDLYSNVASTSAGVELMNCEIILMGNTDKSISKYQIGHSEMKDSIDLEGVLQAIKNSGLEIKEIPIKEGVDRIVNILAKAEASPNGHVRGRRTTMLTDSDISYTRHARSVVNAVIASVVQDPMVYVSGGAEHQGPAGGGPVAVIIEKESE